MAHNVLYFTQMMHMQTISIYCFFIFSYLYTIHCLLFLIENLVLSYYFTYIFELHTFLSLLQVVQFFTFSVFENCLK